MIFDAVVLSLCTGSALAATAALVLAIRKRPPSPVRYERMATETRNELLAVLEELDKLQSLVDKRSNRERMREQRSNGKDPYAMRPGETADEWKKRMREGVRNGTIKAPRLPSG